MQQKFTVNVYQIVHPFALGMQRPSTSFFYSTSCLINVIRTSYAATKVLKTLCICGVLTDCLQLISILQKEKRQLVLKSLITI